MSTVVAAPDRARASSDTKIAVRDLRKIYEGRGSGGAPRQVLALDGATVDVKIGEFVSLLGPSGCGKTTMLKIVAGLIPYNAGRVQIDGKDVREPSANVALVFQNFGLFPWRTVKGNVEFGMEAAGVPAKVRQERAAEYIDLVGLTKFTHSHPGQLSGGMQQRVGLARALAVRPQVLLMDEPFGSLDAHTRELLQLELLDILGRTGATILFVTHSVDEALLLSDRIAVFSSSPGRIVEDIPVDLPHPRDVSIKSLPRYAEMREHIWEQLRPPSVRG